MIFCVLNRILGNCKVRKFRSRCSSVGRTLALGARCRGFESCHLDHIGVSPSGKARDFDSLIRWFESSYPRQIKRRICNV